MPDNHRDNNINTAAGFGPPAKKNRMLRVFRELPNFVKKNRRVILNPLFWKTAARLISTRIHNPTTPIAGAPTLFVATHHKVMTTYFHAVLKLLSFGLGTHFEKTNSDPKSKKTKILLSMHGKTNWTALAPYRGIHIMRDPRDMIVSSYHYHKWTNEEWVHRPDANGETYQEKLNGTDKSNGLFMEIDHFIFFYRETLQKWETDDPDILEVAYEDLMGDDRDDIYEKIFTHLGLKDYGIELGVDLMKLFEASRRTVLDPNKIAPKSHIRSGRSGQWKEELSPKHVEYIERELGSVLRKFGY